MKLIPKWRSSILWLCCEYFFACFGALTPHPSVFCVNSIRLSPTLSSLALQSLSFFPALTILHHLQFTCFLQHSFSVSLYPCPLYVLPRVYFHSLLLFSSICFFGRSPWNQRVFLSLVFVNSPPDLFQALVGWLCFTSCVIFYLKLSSRVAQCLQITCKPWGKEASLFSHADWAGDSISASRKIRS